MYHIAFYLECLVNSNLYIMGSRKKNNTKIIPICFISWQFNFNPHPPKIKIVAFFL